MQAEGEGLIPKRLNISFFYSFTKTSAESLIFVCLFIAYAAKPPQPELSHVRKTQFP